MGVAIGPPTSPTPGMTGNLAPDWRAAMPRAASVIARPDASVRSGARWQATEWPSDPGIGRSGGISVAQIASAIGQRG